METIEFDWATIEITLKKYAAGYDEYTIRLIPKDEREEETSTELAEQGEDKYSVAKRAYYRWLNYEF